MHRGFLPLVMLSSVQAHDVHRNKAHIFIVFFLHALEARSVKSICECKELCNVKLSNAKLRNSERSNAKLSNSKLTNAKLRNTRLRSYWFYWFLRGTKSQNLPVPMFLTTTTHHYTYDPVAVLWS